MRTPLLFAMAFVFIAGNPSPTTGQTTRQVLRDEPVNDPAHQFSPEMFQYGISMYEEHRESLDFVMAVPELIQKSLQKRKVVIYDQN